MIASEKELYHCFDSLGVVARTIRHPPVFTVEDGVRHLKNVPGRQCKCLFLMDKERIPWLVTILGGSRIDLTILRNDIGSTKLSFASPEMMSEILGVEPGSVSPFSLINNNSTKVNVILEKRMMAEKLLKLHPLHNEATTIIAPKDLIKFISEMGHKPLFLDIQRKA
ncbi:MAG: prolyl-tRNA synthetase associated domain-containing protein [Pseudomonadota bacterium]|nr:prolyl-tRNA synthetase associated domain-containing protein [Pseudomonadota bacterium]